MVTPQKCLLTTVNNFLDFVVCSVSEVGQSPACVCQNFSVAVVQESCKSGQKLPYHLKLGGWVLVPAQVGQGPCNVP